MSSRSETATVVRVVVGLLGIALLATGCGGGLTVSMQRAGATVTVTVKDETGLVREATGGADQVPDPLPSAPAAWNPNGELTKVAIYWQSTACSDHPTVTLSGNALVATIDVGPSSGSCDAKLLPNIITLRLGSVIDVTSLTVQMAPR